LYNSIKKGGFQMERKTVKHRQYTIEEKNEIVEMYLSGQTKGLINLGKDLGVSSSVVSLWVKQYRLYGTTVDRRGKATKKENPNIGRPKKPKQLEDMTKKQLIEHVQMLEDIKKTTAYLRRQKKNTKSFKN